ncbi:hypothetical protein KDA23_00990, partial [Candidatus Saccharibacteria bacterium]|nr:hypothetical protein [Candidatus Saccharibacteria bacterium]
PCSRLTRPLVWSMVTARPTSLEAVSASPVQRRCHVNLCELFMHHLQTVLLDTDRRPEYRGHPNILHGQCYVAAEVMYHWMPWYFHIHTMRVGGTVHWFLRSRTGKVYDPTAGQFDGPLDYSQGVRRGFLTKQPSKRAQAVMQRMTEQWQIGFGSR